MQIEGFYLGINEKIAQHIPCASKPLKTRRGDKLTASTQSSSEQQPRKKFFGSTQEIALNNVGLQVDKMKKLLESLPKLEKSLRKLDFPLKKANSLKGIISFLTEKHEVNVHEKGIVTITSKSVRGSNYALKAVADLTSASWFSSGTSRRNRRTSKTGSKGRDAGNKPQRLPHKIRSRPQFPSKIELIFETCSKEHPSRRGDRKMMKE
jgi:hypothetical protein